MIISTAGKPDENLNMKAQRAADELGYPFIKRKKRSIHALQQEYQTGCLIVARDRLELYALGQEQPFFFHPNSAAFRVKRLLRGEEDPYIAAANLTAGMSVLDCTLGLASDCIVASLVAGAGGKVTGIEGHPLLAYIVSRGLKEWPAPCKELEGAMERIEVISSPYQEVLRSLPDNSYDVVYFDPMFAETVEQSEGIAGLRHFALYDHLSKDAVAEAMRVARKRVVLKDHFRSERFQQLGFQQQVRKTSAFHFGVIELA
ncbi:class I SAM-dependent methyltransferase [Bacillus xiapuensis]|uniref:class I SAM-dependent methyltransferase n=1 Tax=Bacillus xiapuensis TaxID=2014075 RepID=UPI000C235C9C|nr:class I SAM-dependent methyltransferase [Bacillus xiapuensis]